MTIQTVEISGLGTNDAPVTYTVEGTSFYELIAVRAIWDGLGAAATYVPCVQILSAAGHVLSQTLGTAVTGGGSADASFFQGVTGGTTGTGTGITQVTSGDGTVTVTNPFGPVTDLSVAALAGTQEQFSGVQLHLPGTNAPLPLAHAGGGALLSYTVPTAPTFVSTGTYAITGTFLMGEEVPAGVRVLMTIAISPGVPYAQQMVPPDAGAGQFIWNMGLVAHVTAGTSFSVICGNGDVNPHTFECDRVNVIRLG